MGFYLSGQEYSCLCTDLVNRCHGDYWTAEPAICCPKGCNRRHRKIWQSIPVCKPADEVSTTSPLIVRSHGPCVFAPPVSQSIAVRLENTPLASASVMGVVSPEKSKPTPPQFFATRFDPVKYVSTPACWSFKKVIPCSSQSCA